MLKRSTINAVVQNDISSLKQSTIIINYSDDLFLSVPELGLWSVGRKGHVGAFQKTNMQQT